jgi:hypothetical protein
MMSSIPISGENAATISYIRLIGQGGWKRQGPAQVDG